ncbi:hypothetical protein HN388_02400 [bacterium]|nr:hypothetical protein [bacterium]
MKLTATILILFIASAAFSQAMDIEYNCNIPTYEPLDLDDSYNYNKLRSLSLTVGFYSNNWQQEDVTSRKGFIFHRHAFKFEPITENPYTREYQALFLQFGYQRKLWEYRNSDLIAGFETGMVFIDDNHSADVPFGNLPETSWNISPTVKLFVPMGERVSAVFGAQGIIFLKDKLTTNPFKSGVIFSVGIELNGGREFNKPKTHL